MNQVVSLETLSRIIVTENCGDTIIVSMINTSVTVTKPNNIVNITNCGS
jgi:hypothetical protein